MEDVGGECYFGGVAVLLRFVRFCPCGRAAPADRRRPPPANLPNTSVGLHNLDSLRGSSVKIGTIQRRLAWPLRKDDTHKSRSVNNALAAHINVNVRVECTRSLPTSEVKRREFCAGSLGMCPLPFGGSGSGLLLSSSAGGIVGGPARALGINAGCRWGMSLRWRCGFAAFRAYLRAYLRAH